MSSVQIISLVVAFTFGVIGYLVGARRGRAGLGFVLGLLLGFVGLIILVIIPRKLSHDQGTTLGVGDLAIRPGQTIPCPSCNAQVGLDATVCVHCGNPVRPQGQVPPVGTTGSPIEPEPWWYQDQGPISGVEPPSPSVDPAE